MPFRQLCQASLYNCQNILAIVYHTAHPLTEYLLSQFLQSKGVFYPFMLYNERDRFFSFFNIGYPDVISDSSKFHQPYLSHLSYLLLLTCPHQIDTMLFSLFVTLSCLDFPRQHSTSFFQKTLDIQHPVDYNVRVV